MLLRLWTLQALPNWGSETWCGSWAWGPVETVSMRFRQSDLYWCSIPMCFKFCGSLWWSRVKSVLSWSRYGSLGGAVKIGDKIDHLLGSLILNSNNNSTMLVPCSLCVNLKMHTRKVAGQPSLAVSPDIHRIPKYFGAPQPWTFLEGYCIPGYS